MIHDDILNKLLLELHRTLRGKDKTALGAEIRQCMNMAYRAMFERRRAQIQDQRISTVLQAHQSLRQAFLRNNRWDDSEA
jgi:hypothetical protein